MKPTKKSRGRWANGCHRAWPKVMPRPNNSTQTMLVATSRKTVAISIFRVRYKTARTPGTRSHNMADVAAHHVAMFSPVKPVMKAPAASGLKMWRPRKAKAYFDALARTHASATPTMSVGTNVGQNRKYRSKPVMSEDSECGVVRKSKASRRFDP